MRIGVITARYSVSGVPLAQARLASALARAGHEVDYVIGTSSQNMKILEPKGTQLLVIGAPTVRSMFRPLCRYLKEVRPDLIFCAEDHLNAAVAIAAIMTRSKVIISGSSRVTPFDTYSNIWFSKRWILKKIVRATAWRQNVRTCVSSGIVDEYRKVMPNLKYHVAYNAVVSPEAEKKASAQLEDPWLPAEGRAGDSGSDPVILAAGSLESWKDFESLINAIYLLQKQNRKVRLIILGEGSKRVALEELIKDLNIDDLVRLQGYEKNPLRFFRRASAFALCSRVESFGNVLVEAMFAGTTPVATDCPTGPREVLSGGIYGYLVRPGDPTSIAKGIVAALDRPISQEKLNIGVSRFTEQAVLARHEELLGIPLLPRAEEKLN